MGDHYTGVLAASAITGHAVAAMDIQDAKRTARQLLEVSSLPGQQKLVILALIDFANPLRGKTWIDIAGDIGMNPSSFHSHVTMAMSVAQSLEPALYSILTRELGVSVQSWHS